MTTEIGLDIHTLILLLGAFQGVFFSILVLLISRKRRPINIHLSIILLVFGLQMLELFLVDSGYMRKLPWLIGFTLPIQVVAPPALYWYIRCLTRPELDNRWKKILPHFGFILLCLPFIIPFWKLDFEHKWGMVKGAYATETWHESVFESFVVLYITFSLVFSCYLFLSIRLLYEHRQKIKEYLSYREKITLNWLTYLLAFFGMLWILMIVYILAVDDKSVSMETVDFLGYLGGLTIIYMGCMGVLQPRIYRPSKISYAALSELPLSTSPSDKIRPVNEKLGDHHSSKDTERQKEVKKYQKSALTISDMQRIGEKLKRVMEEQTLYLEPDLTMPRLAIELSVSPNYLSQTLNSLFEESFFDYVNRHRIEHAKLLLIRASKSKQTVVDIAMASAFNSKSAFYTAFKKHTHTTPTQWLKAQQSVH